MSAATIKCGWCGHHEKPHYRVTARCNRCGELWREPVSAFTFIQLLRACLDLRPIPRNGWGGRGRKAA